MVSGLCYFNTKVWQLIVENKLMYLSLYVKYYFYSQITLLGEGRAFELLIISSFEDKEWKRCSCTEPGQ